MGFKKTEKGNIVYDFDFVPTKLVPLSREQCGYDRAYQVKGQNGETAPVLFEFQGSRHEYYAIVFGFIDKDVRNQLNIENDLCACTNIMLVATFAKLDKDYADAEEGQNVIDPFATRSLAASSVTIPILPMDEARSYLAANKIPKEGYDVIKERIS